MSLDPVTLTLVQNRLDHIAQQMGWVMLRTARSPLFSQGHDFSCFITDSEGWILSQADGLPIHTGGGGLAARALIAAFPGRINPGDVFLLNDPYVAGGNHLPDWVILRPVFAHDRLVAFCCNRGHQSDIGGGAPGGYNSAATEIFQEGLRLPPVKLVDRGVLRDDLWNLLLLNSRAPNLMDGDLRAMMGSTRIGMEEVAKLAAELGANAYAGYFAGILDLGERHMRAEIAALPDGIWRGEDGTDTDCFEDRPYRMRVALHVSGETMTVDFTGTDPQMKGFKNSSIANTWSAVYMALIAYLNPNLPANEGTYRPVTIVAPEGTLVNPRPPAPMTMNTIAPATEIIHAIWTALNAADPARSAAGWGKNSAPTMSGRQPDGAPFVMYHWSGAAGTGAIEGRDGFNGTGGLVGLGALYLPDVELYEQGYPVHFLRQAFRCDGGGAGYRRGGTGLDYAADVAVPSVLSLRGEGLRTPSGFGVGGGGTGRAAVMSIRFDDGRALDPPKYGVIPATPMRIALAGAGGGGWGDPLDREPERVVRDVRDGTVSADAAFRDYG
ncbi:MAG: hydantoinase B/oxoprolinase family protein, partial [Alphaproteobacteria bacterium]|nr:hydantoinase B/oxoprolinase family protein [Alphaproteobacteria bacterium]